MEVDEKKPRCGVYINGEYCGVMTRSNAIHTIREAIWAIEQDDLCEIFVKRIDLTDEEFAKLPEE